MITVSISSPAVIYSISWWDMHAACFIHYGELPAQFLSKGVSNTVVVNLSSAANVWKLKHQDTSIHSAD